MVSYPAGEQLQIIAYITNLNNYSSIFQLPFQLKSNLMNKRMLIVSDCSPFEARDIRQRNELRIPKQSGMGTNWTTELINRDR